MEIQEIITVQKEKLKELLSREEQALGEIIFNNGQCQVLSQSAARYELIINDEANNEVAEYCLDIDEDGMIIPKTDKASGWDRNSHDKLPLSGTTVSEDFSTVSYGTQPESHAAFAAMVALLDLNPDIGEENNLAMQHPEIVADQINYGMKIVFFSFKRLRF